MPNSPTSLQSITHRLETVGQGHLLRFYDQLDDERKRGLLAQIAAMDLESLISRFAFGNVSPSPSPSVPK